MQIRFYSATVLLHTEHIQLWNQQEIVEALFEKGREFAWFESHRQKFERNEQFIFIVFFVAELFTLNYLKYCSKEHY